MLLGFYCPSKSTMGLTQIKHHIYDHKSSKTKVKSYKHGLEALFMHDSTYIMVKLTIKTKL